MVRSKKDIEKMNAIIIATGRAIIHSSDFPELPLEEAVSRIQKDYQASREQAYDAIVFLCEEGLLIPRIEGVDDRVVLAPKSFPVFEPDTSPATGPGGWVTETVDYSSDGTNPQSYQVWKTADEIKRMAQLRESFRISSIKEDAERQLLDSVHPDLVEPTKNIRYYLSATWIVAVIGSLTLAMDSLQYVSVITGFAAVNIGAIGIMKSRSADAGLRRWVIVAQILGALVVLFALA